MKNKEENTLDTWDKLRTDRGPDAANAEDPLARLWSGSANYGEAFQPDVEAGLNRLKKRMQAEGADGKVVSLKARTNWFSRAAAVAVIAVLATVLYYSLPQQGAVEWNTVATAENETRELILPDGSVITLNEQTRLSYNSDLNTADERIIELEGEAFFDVKRRTEQPFKIRTQRALVEVLGTSFNVRAPAGTERAEVEVSTGKVAVRGLAADEEVVLLEANDAVVIEDEYQLFLEDNSPLNSSAWRTGKLQFRSSKLADALNVIERNYQVDLRWDPNTIRNCTITGDWSSESFADVILILEALTGMDVQPLGEKAYQLSGSCN
ncbi:MAG: FecR family protein [Bacteroidota bacterium]